MIPIMTIKRYLAEPHILSGTVRISGLKPDTSKPIINTSETWFHPQGGGQKADRGTIGNSNVLHVEHGENGVVGHVVDSIAGMTVGKEYAFSIDPEWRALNAAYHSAGHLIASIIEHENIGLKAVSGHQFPGEARVEFEGPELMPDKVMAILNERLGRVIESNAEMKIVGDPYTNRSIQTAGYEPIPCGGTHVKSLADVGNIQIKSIKKKGKRLRVSYETALA